MMLESMTVYTLNSCTKMMNMCMNSIVSIYVHIFINVYVAVQLVSSIVALQEFEGL